MIKLTEKSANKIKQVLLNEGVDESPLLRVGIKAGGCSGFTYTMDFDSKQSKFDKIFKSQGLNILCDKKSLIWISGTQIDWSDNLIDRGFRFENPKAKSSCGCKTSFMPEDQPKSEHTPSWM